MPHLMFLSWPQLAGCADSHQRRFCAIRLLQMTAESVLNDGYNSSFQLFHVLVMLLSLFLFFNSFPNLLHHHAENLRSYSGRIQNPTDERRDKGPRNRASDGSSGGGGGHSAGSKWRISGIGLGDPRLLAASCVGISTTLNQSLDC